MKKIIFLMSLMSICSFAELSVEQIQMMVQQIHQKREGVKLDTLELTKEPFVRIQESNSTTKIILPDLEPKDKMSLHAIMNGKAFINDSWKKVGDNILGYTLVYIGKNGIVLRNENQIKKLFLHKHKDKNNYIMTKERG